MLTVESGNDQVPNHARSEIVVITTPGGSFYLGNGYMSYSGGLDPAIDKNLLIETAELREGSCWFFHHNESMAHNGVQAIIQCRVYEYSGLDKRFLQ